VLKLAEGGKGGEIGSVRENVKVYNINLSRGLKERKKSKRRG
jgi:hypothetical protein